MIKKLFVSFLCIFTIIGLAACNNTNTSTDLQSNDKIKVSVTFNAMKEFVAAVGQDKVEVSTIVPEGSQAHGFEPKAQDLAALSTAKVFVYNGLEMDGWAEEAIQAAHNENLIVVNASDGADLMVNESEDHHEHEDEDEHDHNEDEDHEHEDDHDHDHDHEHQDDHEDEQSHEEEHNYSGHSHGKYDPHLWLSLKGAQTQVKNIKDALVQADPDNKDYYEKNYDDYIAQLEGLYEEFNEKFQTVKNKNFVTGHAAFGYLCRDFGLVQNSVSDIYAEGEPSAQQLAKLVEYCKENKVTTIFSEEMASPQVSQTLANEIGAKVETIYTIESSENGETYIERMKENLTKIYNALSE